MSSRHLHGTISEKQRQRQSPKGCQCYVAVFRGLGSQNNGDVMHESILSTSGFDPSLMQSPFAGDQTRAQESMPPPFRRMRLSRRKPIGPEVKL